MHGIVFFEILFVLFGNDVTINAGGVAKINSASTPHRPPCCGLCTITKTVEFGHMSHYVNKYCRLTESLFS